MVSLVEIKLKIPLKTHEFVDNVTCSLFRSYFTTDYFLKDNKPSTTIKTTTKHETLSQIYIIGRFKKVAPTVKNPGFFRI